VIASSLLLFLTWNSLPLLPHPGFFLLLAASSS
jgi:hypothetical protein